MISAYVITLNGNANSEIGALNLKKSSIQVKNDFKIKNFDAVIPQETDDFAKKNNLSWNWPWQGTEDCWSSGLTKSAYETANPKARIACFMSHYKLWCECVIQEEPILIFEHDALFKHKLDLDLLFESKYGIIGLNDPRGATRKSMEFYQAILNNPEKVQDVPVIDEFKIPQGLAGNSAYLIKPASAMELINLTDEFGMWPNDAIMCRQLLPRRLGVTKTFYTTIQNLQSTTTK